MSNALIHVLNIMFLKKKHFKKPNHQRPSAYFRRIFTAKNDILDKPCDYIVVNLTSCVD